MRLVRDLLTPRPFNSDLSDQSDLECRAQMPIDLIKILHRSTTLPPESRKEMITEQVELYDSSHHLLTCTLISTRTGVTSKLFGNYKIRHYLRFGFRDQITKYVAISASEKKSILTLSQKV